MEPLCIALRQRIQGIIRGGITHTVSAYADDLFIIQSTLPAHHTKGPWSTWRIWRNISVQNQFKQKPQGTSKLPTSRGVSSYNFDTSPVLQNIHRKALAAPQGS